MSTNPFDIEPKIYNAPNVLDLRRIQRVDGISFMSSFVEQQNGDALPVTVGVELRLTNQCGNLSITMRRIASKSDSWHCSTCTINLPPDAAADLAQSITSLGK